MNIKASSSVQCVSNKRNRNRLLEKNVDNVIDPLITISDFSEKPLVSRVHGFNLRLATDWSPGDCQKIGHLVNHLKICNQSHFNLRINNHPKYFCRNKLLCFPLLVIVIFNKTIRGIRNILLEWVCI